MNVIGENIKKNRLKNQLSTRDLAKIIGVSHTAVNKYEKGILSPNKKMIRKMARIFKVKTQKLVTDSSVEINIKDIKYRDDEKITKKNKDLAEYLTKEKLEKYSKLLEYFPDERFRYFEIEKFRENVHSLGDIEQIASNVRRKLGVGELGIFNLLELLENNGLIILFIEPMAGFTAQEGYILEKYLFITLCTESSGDKERISLSNELARLILDIKDPDLSIDRVISRFTEEFLISRDIIFSDLGKKRKKLSFYELVKLKEKYRLSMATIILRALHLKIITENEKIRLFNSMKTHNMEYETIVEIEREKSVKLEKMAIEAVLEKYIDYKKGAEFLNMENKKFLDIIGESKISL